MWGICWILLTVCRQVSAFPNRSDWEAISTGGPELYFMRKAAMTKSCKSAHVFPSLPLSARGVKRVLSFFVMLFCLFGPNARFLWTWYFSNSISILSPKSFPWLPTIGHMGVALAEPGLFAQPLSTHMIWESHVGNLGGENRYCCSPKPHTQNRRSRKKASPIFLEFLPQISLLSKSQPQPKLGGGISRSFLLAEKSTNHCTLACPTVNY